MSWDVESLANHIRAIDPDPFVIEIDAESRMILRGHDNTSHVIRGRADPSIIRQALKQVRAECCAMTDVRLQDEVPLRHCARCNQDHPVAWQQLTNPIEDKDGTKWTHWAPCPVNGEPILMREARSEAEQQC